MKGMRLDKRCVVFRLSNRVIQANFVDGSRLFLDSAQRVSYFVKHEGEPEEVIELTGSEGSGHNFSSEHEEKLHYIKEFLSSLSRKEGEGGQLTGTLQTQRISQN